MKIKIAIIVPSMRGGGAEKVMANLIRYLDKDKFDIRLILIKKEGPYLDLIPNTVSVIDLNARRVRYSIFKLIGELNKYNPDVILSTLGHLNLAILSIKIFLKANPKIIVRHAIAPTVSMKKLSPVNRFIQMNLYKKLYNKADVVLAQCKDMQDDLEDVFQINKTKLKFIYNPLDIEKIQTAMIEKNPYDRNKINLVSVGRLTEQKGFDVLIRAIKLVSNRYPNIRLTILGDGEMKHQLIELVDKLDLNNQVVFESFKTNPYPYYHYSDMYILSSRYEGFPNTLLEALACKTKVIATNCKNGPREIIGENQYGYLVEVENPKNLADEIINYIGLDNKTSNRAEFFEISKVIKDYQKLIISLTNKSHTDM